MSNIIYRITKDEQKIIFSMNRLYLDEKNRERSPVCNRNFKATTYQLANIRGPFRVEFSWHREFVVTVESRLILERGYPGGRGGYLGHDQVAINIASRRSEACIERQMPLSRSGMEIDIVATAWRFWIRSKCQISSTSRSRPNLLFYISRLVISATC